MNKREALAFAFNLGWTMVFSLLIPLLVGIWLDKKLETEPLFILVGALIGILAATLGVARMALRTFALIADESSAPEAEANDEEEPE